MLIALLPFYITSLGYITEEEYAALWAAMGYSTTNKLVVIFAQVYGLPSGTITDIEGNVIEVRFFDGLFWPALVVFSFDVGLSCAKPCHYLTFPL